MKIHCILSSLILTIVLVLANVSTALAMPPLPSSFYGTVKVNSANAPAGAIISARINGVEYANMTAKSYLSEIVYVLDMPGDDPDTPGVIEGGQTGDTVVFYINGMLASPTGTWASGSNVSLNLTAHAPVADDQSVTTVENTAKAITLTGTDADGGTLTFSIVSGPSHGSLSGSAPNVTYTPAANYNGTDSFTFRAYDGRLYSNIATVSITVTGVNHAPVITQGASTSVCMSEDGSPKAFSLTLNATDVDSDTLTWSILTAASHGTASASGTGTSKAIGYTPTANYNGTDSFVVQVSDGNGGTDTITVKVNIAAVNDAPVANAQSVSTAKNNAKAITLTATDVDSGTLTYSVVAGPSHGSLSGSAPNVTYTPAANYSGTDSFTFKAYDSRLYSNIATVSITVTAVNHAPVITQGASTSVCMSEDGSPKAFSLTLNATDVDSDTLTWSILTAASHGTASASGTGTSKSIGYTPTANYNGTDSFVVQVSDGNGGTDTITVKVNIAAVNDAPVANAQSVSTAKNTAKAITLTATDVDSGTLTYSVVAGPSHGSLSGSAPNVTYTPAANYSGTDSFTFKAYDGTLYSNPAKVSITVTAVNDAPVITEGASTSVSMSEDGSPTAFSLTLHATDVDSGVLTWSILTAASHGTASASGKGAAKTICYTPTANYNGTDSFVVQVSDGNGGTDTITVKVNIAAVNDAPVANAQSVSTAKNNAKAITLTATDVDSGTLTYSVVAGPSHGSLSGSAPNVTYTPAANYSGTDSFTFKAHDGALYSNIATVSITVKATNCAYIITEGPSTNVSMSKDGFPTPFNLSLHATNVDAADTLAWSISTPAGHGTASTSGTGSSKAISYTPASNYLGSDNFVVQVSDGNGDTDTITVNVTITAVEPTKFTIFLPLILH